LLSLPLALAALAGAQGPPATSVPVGTPPAVVAEGGQVVKAPAPNAPTVEECREFGEKLVAAIHAGDRATVDRLYRFAELAERSISDLQLSAYCPRERRSSSRKSSRRRNEEAGSRSCACARSMDGRACWCGSFIRAKA
jgi:hypothetical protein